MNELFKPFLASCRTSDTHAYCLTSLPCLVPSLQVSVEDRTAMVDPAFKGVGKNPGLDIWRIEVSSLVASHLWETYARMAQASQTHTCSLRPFLLCTIAFLLPPRRVELHYLTHFCPQKLKVVPVEKKTYGKFHSGDSYIVLQVSHWQAGPMGEGMCVLYRNLSLLPQHCSCGLSIVKVCVYCAWYCTMTRTVFSRGSDGCYGSY